MNNETDFAELLTQLQPGQETNMNTFFRSSRGGLISSAEWEGTGYAQFIENQQLEKNINQLLKALLTNAEYCPVSEKKKAAQFCFSPQSDELVLNKLQNPDLYQGRWDQLQADVEKMTPEEFRINVIRRDWGLSKGETELGVFEPEIFDSHLSDLDYIEWGYHQSKMPPDPTRSCLQAWAAFLRDPRNTSNLKLQNTISIEEIGKLWSQFLGSNPTCQGESFENIKLIKRIENSQFDPKLFKEKQKKFKMEMAMVSEENTTRIKSLAGIGFPNFEKINSLGSPPVASCQFPLSFGRAIEAFAKGSLEKMVINPKSYTHALDQRRHQACENFKF